MQPIDLSAITIDKISIPLFADKKIEADMLRLDKIHPLISGNKYFKLRHYLTEAKEKKAARIITFGGAWSNHIIATAAACQLDTIPCTGIIRGERPATLSDTLRYAMNMGMELVFVSREDFTDGKIPLHLHHRDNFIIQQGGMGEQGVKGAAEILNYAGLKNSYSHICCAVGTGTMMAGICRAALPGQQITGISVMKNNLQLNEEVRRMSGLNEINFFIHHEYHFGGYAKNQPALIDFMNDWYKGTNIPTDFVYTGKLCFAIHDLVQQDYFPEGSRVLLIHSGGLTGNASLKNGTLIY